MDITCYRETEISRQPHTLPAAIYNLAKKLIARSQNGVVFVPIRSMQYLAILDGEEFAFLDHQYKNWIEISWQNFHPQFRTSLKDPVPYEAVFYAANARDLMPRLMSEFPKSLRQLDAKHETVGSARVLKFEKKQAGD